MTGNDLKLKDTLFLHMGPGFNASVERRVLGQENKNVLYWDQPVVIESKGAFKKLLIATENVFDQLYGAHQRPIHIQAHSFGGYLALQLLKTRASQVESVTILNSSFVIIDGYLNLIRQIEATVKDEAYKDKIKAFLASNPKAMPTENLVDSLIDIIAADPGYMKHYFYRPKAFEAYANIAANLEPLNIFAFKNILVDYVDYYFESTLKTSYKKKFTVYLGMNDPFYTSKCKMLWHKLLPQSEIITVNNIGHFIHLEEKL